MKKQILILVLASICGISTAWSQNGAMPGSAPRPLTDCTSGPLNPIAGVPYDYSAEIIPEGGTAYWFATFNNTTFIEDGQLTTDQEAIGGDFILSASNYQNTNPGAISPDTTTITWKSGGLAQIDDVSPLFLGIHYTADPASGCSDNLKVYRINPINAFLVNVLNLGAAAYGEEVESCFSDIESAEYDLANNIMMYDFGQNILAYEVIAANFTDSYDLSFRIEGLEPDQDANIYWNYENDFSTATLLAGGPFSNGIVAGPNVTTDETNTSGGVSVFVWLEVNNNNFEGLQDTPITLAVSGVNEANETCIRWDDCAVLVDLAADFGEPNAPDFATHVLQARPTVLPDGGLNFENQVQP